MENKLSVRDLRISFRTSNGKLQAVRGIDFDLPRGETLAIVGESGSGKSVTSKAILGILAGNAIIESGEILYDGKDLLKISEEDFHKIRGDKIAMIFQDPMSSLNPIVRIGRQLTEAMLLKGKARQRESRANFNSYLKALRAAMIESAEPGQAARLGQMCSMFNKFEFKHIELEKAYRAAHIAASETAEELDKLIFEFEHDSIGRDAADRVSDIARQARAALHPYVVAPENRRRVRALASALPRAFRAAKKSGQLQQLLLNLRELREIVAPAVARPAPNFFRMGYYLSFSGKPLPDMSVEALNDYLLDYLDREFMNGFIDNAERALRWSAEKSCANMRLAIDALKAARAVYAREALDHRECLQSCKALTAAVARTLDPLAVSKDSMSRVFGPTLKSELEKYFSAITHNKRALAKYARERRKYERITSRGGQAGWELAEPNVTDIERIKEKIARDIDRLIEHYEACLRAFPSRDHRAEALDAIDYLMHNASGVVEKVTRSIAKHRAIRLMREVGIAEPHRRYRQYPFEFSGGMRQRIVIAIALAADPDILICDEPTTALDVTIQSQILELINKLKRERRLTVIFITHDLGVVANMADRVAVMYAGKIVEYGTAMDIFYDARHPYTWALLSSMPDLDTNERLESIPGTPPNMIYPPKGDAFAPRNRYAMKIDFEREPPMFKISETHAAATWLLHPDAPRVDPPKIITDRIKRMKERRASDDAQ